jgi:hypothetical protein
VFVICAYMACAGHLNVTCICRNVGARSSHAGVFVPHSCVSALQVNTMVGGIKIIPSLRSWRQSDFYKQRGKSEGDSSQVSESLQPYRSVCVVQQI